MDYLPLQVYGDEQHVVDLQNAIDAQFVHIQAMRDNLLLQVRPGTANAKGLTLHEKDYGIVPDYTITPMQRLAQWRAKRRGKGTSTIETLQRIAQSYYCNPVKIIEYPTEYRFAVQARLNDDELLDWRNLANSIRELRPAHLAYFMQAEIPVTILIPINLNLKKIEFKTGINMFGLDEVRFDGMYSFDGTRIFTSLFSRGPCVPRIELRTTLDMWETEIPLLDGSWQLNGSKILGPGNRRGPQLQSVDFTLHTAMDSWGVRGSSWRMETGVNMFGVKTFYFDGSSSFDGTRIFTSEFETGPHVPRIEVTKRWCMSPQMDVDMDFTAGCKVGILAAAKLEMNTSVNAGGAAGLQQIDVCAGIHAGPECSTSMTYDTMWLLDGSYTLDGSRKLNADIITENI